MQLPVVNRISIFLGATALLTTTMGGCQTTSSRGGSANYGPTQAWNLSASTENDDVTQLAEDFYREVGTEQAPYATFRLRAKALAAAHPNNGTLHEVMAYDARLRADEDASFRHFMLAIADTRYDATALALSELLAEPRTRAQWSDASVLLTKVAASHPSLLVRAQAQATLLSIHTRFGDADKAKAGVASLDLIDKWRVLGAFDNDQGKGFLTPYGPEAGVVLDSTLPGRLGEIRWRPLLAPNLKGVHGIGGQVSPSTNSVAYLVTWVKSPKQQDVALRLTSSVPLRAWVEGSLVLSEENVKRGALDALTATVRLKKGWNEILVKSSGENRYWTFAARLTGVNGEPLSKLDVTSKRPAGTNPIAVDSSAKEKPAAVDLVDFNAPKTTKARAAFIASRMLRRAGLDTRLGETTLALIQFSKSSAAIFERALALWDTDESGKALDLLNLGVTRNGDELGAFLVKRARFYRGKRLWDKAIADLQLTTGEERNAIVAEMELASIYGSRGWRLQECEHYEAVQKRWPGSGWILRSQARCMKQRNYDGRAIELYEQALRLEPGHLFGLRQLSQLYADKGDHARAWELQQRILELDPHSPGPLVTAAEFRRRASDIAGAENLLLLANARDPDWEKPLKQLGDLAFEVGNKEGALKYWRAAIEKNPDDTRLADVVDFMAPESLGIIEKYLPSEADIDTAIAKGMNRQPMPGTNVSLLLDHEVTEIFNDGSARAVVTVVKQAVTKKGRDQIIQTNLPRRGKVKLLRAVARGVDGREQEASSVNGGVVRFRNIGAGSTTVVQYVHNRPPQPFLPNHYVGAWYFEGLATEYLNSTWVLIAPDSRTLNVEILGGGIEQTETKVGSEIVRTFSSKDRPPFFGEPQMPPLRDLLARVNVSTVEGWDEYVRWERALLKNAFTSNPQLVSLAKKLVGDETDPLEKLDRLFHYVAEEIRYQQDYENTIAGVRPHACPVVLERGYGDCKDKAVLLILLAKHAGIDVDFAILRTTPAGEVRKKIPNQQFNHAIVYVPKQAGIDKGRFLDPTTDGLDIGSLRADDQGATSLVLDPDTGAFAFHDIPFQSPEFETESQVIDVKIAADMKATAHTHGVVRGAQGSQLRRILRSDETARKVFEAIGGALFSGATVKSFDSKNKDNIWAPVEFELDLDVTASIQPMNDAKRLRVPRLFPFNHAAKLQVRRHPLVIGLYATSTMVTNFDFPAGASVTIKPNPFVVENGCFRHERTVVHTPSVKGRGPTVKVQDITVRHCNRVSVADYPAFRKDVLDVVGRQQDPIAFKMNKVVAGPSTSSTPTLAARESLR